MENSFKCRNQGQRVRATFCRLRSSYYRLEEPIMEIVYGAKTVFTHSAITPPKVNRFWMKSVAP